jgi:glycosyl transferase family 25
MIKSINDIKHAFYINLEHRTDRKDHVEKELKKIGIKSTRFNAIKMEKGAIGCSLSHLKCLQTASTNKWEHILICEDDIEFLDSELFLKQLNKFLANHDSWDVILLAGNNVPPYTKIDDTCIKVTRCQTTTGYIVNGHYINKLIDNVKSGLTYLLKNQDSTFYNAIDKYWISLQEKDNWYLITPLTVIKRSDYSDIEKKETNYKNLMIDIDKKKYLYKHPLPTSYSILHQDSGNKSDIL